MAIAQLFLSGASFAVDRYECLSRCSAENDTRNAGCPSPYDSSSSMRERDQCMRNNHVAYVDCIKICPPPPSPRYSDDQASFPAKRWY